jgi:hypothetical protein
MKPGEDRRAHAAIRFEAQLTELVYELLDAHDDTASLAAGLGDLAWLIHLDYLRALQRRGREILARLSIEGRFR